MPASHSTHCWSQATELVISLSVAGGLNRVMSYQTSTPKITAKRMRNFTLSQKPSGLRVPLAFQGNRGSAGGVLCGTWTGPAEGGPGGPGVTTVTVATPGGGDCGAGRCSAPAGWD